MRGTLARVGHLRPQSGIIPAYAGNTSCRKCGCVPRWDHPRICGEHQFSNVHGRQQRGSSPHMRGTHSRWKTAAVPLGIIPAYAGNTCRYIRHWFSARDHPRICGEHIASNKLYNRPSGSSPHMRGTPGARYAVWHYAGIIPAYAGNTSLVILIMLAMRDHPRICGEHFSAFNINLKPQGSSPHMRGTH